MWSGLKLLVAALSSDSENSENPGTPPEQDGPESMPLGGGGSVLRWWLLWLRSWLLWLWPLYMLSSGWGRLEKIDSQQPITESRWLGYPRYTSTLLLPRNHNTHTHRYFFESLTKTTHPIARVQREWSRERDRSKEWRGAAFFFFSFACFLFLRCTDKNLCLSVCSSYYWTVHFTSSRALSSLCLCVSLSSSSLVLFRGFFALVLLFRVSLSFSFPPFSIPPFSIVY